MLKFYRVDFLHNDKIATAEIAISNRDQLDTFLDNIGLLKDNIIKCRSGYKLKKHFIDLNEQLLLLIQIKTVINNNVNIGDVFANWFSNNKKNISILRYMQANRATLGLFLEVLGFGTIVIEIIKASSQLDENLDYAVAALNEEIQSINETSGVIQKNLFKLIFALLTLASTPSLIKALEVGEQERSGSNIVVDTLLFLDANTSTIMLVVVVCIVAIWLYKDQLLNMIKNIYPFSLFNRIITLKNSLLFINILQPANSSGIKHTATISQFAKINKFAKLQSGILLTQINEMQLGLAEALQFSSFAKSLVSGMASFDRTAQLSEQSKTLDLLREMLKQELRVANKKLNSFANASATTMLIGLIFILFFALMVPRFAVITNVNL